MHEPDPREELMVACAPPGEADSSAPIERDEAWLLHALEKLRDEFTCPPEDAGPEEQAREAIALAGAGLAETALLATATICVCRCSRCGPAAAYGPWASSVILGSFGGVLASPGGPARRDSSGTLLHGELPFESWLRLGERANPTILTCSAPSQEDLIGIEQAFAGYAITLVAAADSGWWLVAAPRAGAAAPVTVRPDNKPLFVAPNGDTQPVVIMILVSPLWRAVATARSG